MRAPGWHSCPLGSPRDDARAPPPLVVSSPAPTVLHPCLNVSGAPTFPPLLPLPGPSDDWPPSSTTLKPPTTFSGKLPPPVPWPAPRPACCAASHAPRQNITQRPGRPLARVFGCTAMTPRLFRRLPREDVLACMPQWHFADPLLSTRASPGCGRIALALRWRQGPCNRFALLFAGQGNGGDRYRVPGRPAWRRGHLSCHNPPPPRPSRCHALADESSAVPHTGLGLSDGPAMTQRASRRTN